VVAPVRAGTGACPYSASAEVRTSYESLKGIHEFKPVFFAFGSVLNVGVKLNLHIEKHIFVVVLEGGTNGECLASVADIISRTLIIGGLKIKHPVNTEHPVAQVLSNQVITDKLIACGVVGV
jgi:hypothetical protein